MATPRKRTPAPIVIALLLGACGGSAPMEEGEGGDGAGGDANAAWFVESARERGIDFVHRTGQRDRYLYPEIACGGGALFDMDGDGDLDAYLVQSGGVLVPPEERPGNRLFANRGDGRFEDVTSGSGAGDRGYGMGAATGDYDGDADVDLYVTNLEENALLRNDGRGRFEDVTLAAGASEPLWSSSAAFFDPDRDGDLDLYVVNYIFWSVESERTCYAQPFGETYCGPAAYDSPAPDTLLRNEGDGTFVDVSVEAGLKKSFGNGLGVGVSDFDGDGWLDVFVANDGNKDQLWINRGELRFVDKGVAFGCAADQDGQLKAGMGVGVIDVDDDSDEDLLVVNLGGELDSFFRNDRTHFVDQTASIGLTLASRAFTRFGVGFQDFDQDGYVDLYQANGRVSHGAEVSGPDPFAESNLLYRGGAGARFEEVLPRGGVARPLIATSRAAIFGDVDGDGAVDVLVVNRDGPAHLLLNRTAPRGNWIALRVLTAGGRDALGAEVRIRVRGRTVTRRVRSAYSYCAANDPRVHVGLGDAGAVEDVTVRWVDGHVESFGPRDAGRVWELSRGAGQPVREDS